MEFNLREYIKEGLLDAVGKMSDYQVILNSAGWLEKGVLLEEDLAEIQAKIAEKNTAESAEQDAEIEENASNIEEDAEMPVTEEVEKEPLILE